VRDRTGFIPPIKHECFNRLIPLSEQRLQRSLAEYVADYHDERDQGTSNELIAGELPSAPSGLVRRRQRIGETLNDKIAPRKRELRTEDSDSK
jgi:hypothetical protein